MSSVKTAAAEYMAAGWKLCRIEPASKGPKYQGWAIRGNEVKTADAFLAGYGVGLLHAYSGTCSIDIDHSDHAERFLEQRGIDLGELLEADDAVQIVSGRPNSAKLLYALPEARVSVNCAPYTVIDPETGKPRGKHGLNFRSASREGASMQDVLPPSIHPDMGRAYEWRFGPFSHWSALPPLPAALEALWTELAEPAQVVDLEAAGSAAPPSEARMAEVEQFLEAMDPNESSGYDNGAPKGTWLYVGMVLSHEFDGNREGFRLWDQWSRQSHKYNDVGNRERMEAHWRSFRGDKARMHTLNGWLQVQPAPVDAFPIVESPTEASQPAADPQVADGGEFIGGSSANPADVPADVAIEPAYEKSARLLLQNYVVLQTGGARHFFLMPGHPVSEIAAAAGHSGGEIDTQQMRMLFAPYMPMRPAKHAMERMDAPTTIGEAKWRRSVHRVAFNPGGAETYTDNDGRRYLNGYKPIPVVPKEMPLDMIRRLEWLGARVLDDYENPTGGQFTQWLFALYAYVLRNPGVKVKWAPLLYSRVKGTGKTTLLEVLPRMLFGSQYCQSMVHSVLRERFAAAKFDATWWVCISEMHTDDGKVDAKRIANKLKPWITDPYIPMEKKGVDAYDIPNRLQLTATSNHEDSLFIEEGNDERRWLIGQMLEEPLSEVDKSYLNPLFNEHTADPDAQAWIHWYFRKLVDISWFDPNRPPPITLAKKTVQLHSRSAWEDDLHEALELGHTPFDKDIVTPTELSKGLLYGRGCTMSGAKQLLDKIGAKRVVRTSFARNLYIIRNHAQWQTATTAQIQTHFRGGPRPFTVDDCADLI